MPRSKKPTIRARKSPVQARSTELVECILEAAIRVLTRDGARRFTTVRVAEEAGVSVGSLYQYFPNKESILFRLQANEWVETWGIMEEILADRRHAPLDRLRRAVLTFFRSEREEAALRVALDDAGALFRDGVEARAHVAKAKACVVAFVVEAVPGLAPASVAFAGDFIMTSMAATAEKITEQGRSRSDVDAWARTSAEMYCGYLLGLVGGRERSAYTRRDPPRNGLAHEVNSGVLGRQDGAPPKRRKS